MIHRRLPSRPITMSVHLLLASVVAGGVRANPAEHAAPVHGAAEAAPEPKEKSVPAHAEPLKPAAVDEHERPASSVHTNKPEHAKPAPEQTEGDLLQIESTSLLKLGNNLTERSDYESAEIAYRQILANPLASADDTKSALLGLAHMFRKQGTNLTKAAAIYEKYLKEYPGDDRSPEALLELGRTLRSMGAYKLAISRFYNVINSTLKVSGEGFDRYQLLARTAQFEIAETHLESGNYAEAGKFFTRLRLLELAPIDRARAQFKAAYALHMNNDLDAAVPAFRSYIEQWPRDTNAPEARYWLAVDLRATKRGQEAMAVTLDLLRAEKAEIASDPKRWLYWQRRTGNQLANDFFEGGDIHNAQAIYTGLAALSAEPVWKLPLTYQIGLCVERLGDNETARASYQSIIETAGATPSPDLAEVVRMASWRIDHIGWREKVGQQVTAYFETTTGKNNPSPAAAASAAAVKTASTP